MADVTLQAIITAKDEASSKIKSAQLSFGKLAGAIAVGEAAYRAFASAANAAVGFLSSSVRETISNEAAQTRLAKVVQTSTHASDAQVKALFRQADALEQVGVVGKDAILQAQGQLAAFDLTADSIQRLTPAILNYIANEKGVGASAEEAQAMTNGLAQALQGNFQSLSKTGFILDDMTKKMISQGTETERVQALTKVLNSTYAGFNERMRQTAAGGVFGMQVAMKNLKQQIGDALIPIVIQFSTTLTQFLQSERLKAWVASIQDFITNKLLPAFQAIAKFISTVIVPLFRDTLWPIWKNIYDTLAPYIPTLKEIVKYLGIMVGGAIIGGILVLSTAVLGLSKVFDAVVRSIQAVFNWIEKVVGKVADFNRVVTNSVIGKVKNVGSSIGNFVSGIFGGGKAGGGYVSAGTPYMVGEKGPELFVPSQSGTIMPNGQAGGITINVTGNTVRNDNDLKTIITEVKRALNRQQVLANLRV